MEKKRNTQNVEKIMREMIQSAKQEAPENLKYRIMQQIETEQALSPQKPKREKGKREMPENFRGIFGTMYLLIFLLSLFTVLFGGEEAILSKQFILTATLIVVTLTSFYALTRLEAYLRKRRK